MTVMPSRIYQEPFVNIVGKNNNNNPWLRAALETETHAACYVGRRTDHRCAGKNPGGELRDGDAGKDADEQLAGQSLFEPILAKDGTCTLWFAAEILWFFFG